MSGLAWGTRARRAVGAGFAGVAAALAAGATAPAAASDYRFQVGYSISLNGLKIGEASLIGRFEGSNYRLDGLGQLTGIAGILYDYTGSAAATGNIGAAGAMPNAFSADATDGKREAKVRMTLSGDRVDGVEIEPEQSDHPARVAITPAHMRGIVDPVSALIALGGYSGGDLDRSACQRSVPVFNGRERFDVTLEYADTRTVSDSRGGYSGPALICRARYRPVAGHRADRDEIKYVADRVVFEVMLVPAPDSDMLVPYRVSVSTALGPAAIQATRIAAEGRLETRTARAD